eukprot:403334452
MATKIRPLTKQQQEQQQNSNSPQKRERYNKNEDLELTPITHQNQLTDEQNQSQIENQIIHDEEMVNQMLDDLSDENKSSIVAGIDFREDGIIQNGPGNSKTGDKQRFKTIDKTSELQIGVMSSTCKTSANFKDALVQNQYSKVNRDSVIDPKGSSQNLNFMSTQKFLKDQYEEVNEDSSYSSRPFGKASSDLVKHQDSSNNRDSSRGAIIQEHYFEESQDEDKSSSDSKNVKEKNNPFYLQKQPQTGTRRNPIAEAIGTQMMRRLVNISEFTVKFHAKNFLKLFVYHLIFHFFGPLICVIVPIFDTFGMVRNMMFWGIKTFTRPVISQYLTWFFIFIMTVLYLLKTFQVEIFNYKITLDGVYFGQWLMLALVVVIRSFIVAVRYGYSSELRFKVLTSTRADAPFITRDLLVLSWLTTHPNMLDIEIDSVFWRNQVEDHRLIFKFYENLDHDMNQKFHDVNYYKKDENEFDMKSTQKMFKSYESKLRQRQNLLKELDPFESDYEMYSIHSMKTQILQGVVQQVPSIGRLVFKEMAIFAGAHCKSTAKLVIFVPLVKCILPYLVRMYDYGNPLGPNMFAWDSYLYFLCELPVIYFLSWANFLFVAAGLIDFQRRVLMIKAIGSLINPFKQDLSLKYQIFPCVILTCKESLHSWFSLRICAMDFGRKYMVRIFMYCSTFLAFYTFFVVILLLDYFNFINFQLPLMVQVYAIFEVFMVLGVILVMLYLGAVVNQQFVEDRLQLVKLKQTMLYMKINIKGIRAGDKFSGAYIKILKTLFLAQAHLKTEEEDKNHIDDLVAEIDAMIQRLEIDGEHRPLRLMGLKATFSLMNQIYTTLFTIAFAVAQKMVS